MSGIFSTRWRWLIVAVAVVVVVLVAVTISRSGRAAASPAPTGGSTGAASPGSSPSGSATVAASPAASPSATPAPTVSGPAWAAGLSIAAPVALDRTATATSGVRASLASVTAVQATAHGPGERSGPAVRIVLTLHNGGAAALDLGSVVVDVYADNGAPGRHYIYDPSITPLSGSLAVGADATGTYLVGLADPSSAHVNITVTYAGDQPALVFQGTVPA